MDDRKVITIEHDIADEFEKDCNILILQGYKMAAQNCWFGGNEGSHYPKYQAIFVKPEALAGYTELTERINAPLNNDHVEQP